MSSQFEIGTTLTFTCETGFAAAGSTDTIVCQDNHQWSAKPKCQIRQNPSQPTDTSIPKSFCKLPNVANGKFINVVSAQIELGSTLRFKCDTGFTASESGDTVTCQGNHQWSAEPICQDNSNASRRNAVSASMMAVYVCLSIFVTIISAIVVICIRKRRQSCTGWNRFK
ncbi:membrane cofactor protein-like [Mercenaria mercenaria]|uniref:membrane cofactor protein-like n=1 Tax=Mercenaria mercenaria TaxID=6596 RepID=UPI00234EE40F|nr:membrane cofactor protein-like [Mercenaria mercenaria]